jgi:hypothetical protein
MTKVRGLAWWCSCGAVTAFDQEAADESRAVLDRWVWVVKEVREDDAPCLIGDVDEASVRVSARVGDEIGRSGGWSETVLVWRYARLGGWDWCGWCRVGRGVAGRNWGNGRSEGHCGRSVDRDECGEEVELGRRRGKGYPSCKADVSVCLVKWTSWLTF